MSLPQAREEVTDHLCLSLTVSGPDCFYQWHTSAILKRP
uniref:Uncharacterized protein n=1 Tax=Anguilla anguilla TaxID=7936 RepID=A0A0E9QSC0_ANGAN